MQMEVTAILARKLKPGFLAPEFLRILPLLSVLLFLSWPGYLQSGDNACMVATARSMVHDRSFLIDASLQPPQPDMPWEPAPGKVYSRFGIGSGLILVPFVVLEDIASLVLDRMIAGHLVFSLVSPFFALLSAAIFFDTLKLLGVSASKASSVALVTFGFTILYPYAVYDGYEMQQACLVLLAFNFALRNRWAAVGCWLGVLLTIKITNVLLIPCFLILLARDRTDVLGSAIRLAFPTFVAFLLMLAYNDYRYGAFLEFGYGREGGRFAWSNLRSHFLPLFFSNEMGLFNFSPILLLAILGVKRFAHLHRSVALFIGVLLLSQIAFFASFHEPKGSMSWGPRYLVPFVPLAAIPLGFRDFSSHLVKILSVLLLCASLAVNFIAVAQRPLEYDVVRLNAFGDLRSSDSQIIGCWKMWWHKMRSGQNNYPLALFQDGKLGIWDTSKYETFRGVNIWYWQAALRYDKPMLFWLFSLYAGFYALLLIHSARLLAKNDPG